jgi:hypothetical protein
VRALEAQTRNVDFFFGNWLYRPDGTQEPPMAYRATIDFVSEVT